MRITAPAPSGESPPYLTKATFWSAGEILLRSTSQLLLTVVLARLLSPADFGVIAIVLVFTSISMVIADAGLASALIQRPRVDDNDCKSVFAVQLSIGLLAFAALCASAPMIANYYDHDELRWVLCYAAALIPLAALCSVQDALLIREMAFSTRARIEFLSLCAAIPLSIYMAIQGFKVWSLATYYVMSAAVRALLLLRQSTWIRTGTVRFDCFQGMYRFGGYIMLSGLLDTLTVRLQSFLIGKIANAGTLGQYSAAQNIQLAPTTLLANVLNRVGFSALSKTSSDASQTRSLARRLMLVSLTFFMPLMVLLAILSEPIVSVLLGPQWTQSAVFLSVLAIAAAVWPAHVVNLVALKACGRADLHFRLEVIKKIVAIGLIVALSSHGALGVAYAVLCSSAFGLIMNGLYSKAIFGYGLRDQILDLGCLGLVTAAAALVATLAGTAVTDAARPFAVAAVFIAAYLMLIASLSPILRTERATISRPTSAA